MNALGGSAACISVNHDTTIRLSAVTRTKSFWVLQHTTRGGIKELFKPPKVSELQRGKSKTLVALAFCLGAFTSIATESKDLPNCVVCRLHSSRHF
jgi:hypothetical protein